MPNNYPERICNNIIEYCKAYLTLFPQKTSSHSNQELVKVCKSRLEELDNKSAENVAQILSEINEAIVKQRSSFYRGLWKIINNGVNPDIEPAGMFRTEVEKALHELLGKGTFVPTTYSEPDSFDSKICASSMTTRNEVIRFFSKPTLEMMPRSCCEGHCLCVSSQLGTRNG